MKQFIYISIFVLLTQALSSQYQHSTIDTVISCTWGTGQNNGQGEEFYPANIFGKPDTSASDKFQSSDPKQICSIGLGGEIIVGFSGYEIVDGPGADFTIFENAFINPINQKVFAEPAMISVSIDGINFYDFPFDSLTLSGCAGITPTNGKEDCYDTSMSGGDKFDLADIGINRVKYIRIKDITEMLLSNSEHPFYDPILSGFDLDAVAGINLRKINPTDVTDDENTMLKIQVSESAVIVETGTANDVIKLFNYSGILLQSEQGNIAAFTNLNKGVYFIVITTVSEVIIRRKIII